MMYEEGKSNENYYLLVTIVYNSEKNQYSYSFSVQKFKTTNQSWNKKFLSMSQVPFAVRMVRNHLSRSFMSPQFDGASTSTRLYASTRNADREVVGRLPELIGDDFELGDVGLQARRHPDEAGNGLGQALVQRLHLLDEAEARQQQVAVHLQQLHRLDQVVLADDLFHSNFRCQSAPETEKNVQHYVSQSLLRPIQLNMSKRSW